MEHLRNAIIFKTRSEELCWKLSWLRIKVVRTRKHSDLIDIVEFSKILAVKAGPQICDENLGTLVKPNSFAVEPCLVAETGEVLGEQVYKTCRGEICVIDAVDEASAKFLNNDSISTGVSKYRGPSYNSHCRELHLLLAGIALALGTGVSPRQWRIETHVSGPHLCIPPRQPRSPEL